MAKFKDLTGMKFGRLTAKSFTKRPGKQTLWHCLCECGNEHSVACPQLTGSKVKSCGCLRREVATARATKHGQGKSGQMSAEYTTWAGMWTRCTNPKVRSYKDYGARGIVPCERWASFENFYADMGPRPSKDHQLDRLNNDLGYTPENCAWRTRSDNMRNTRSALFLTLNGVTLSVHEWADRTGISAKTIRHRLRLPGWDAEQALTLPPYAKTRGRTGRQLL